MSLHKVVELIFTIVMLLFLAIIVLGVIVVISIVEQLTSFEVGSKEHVIFIVGMFAVFIYIMKMIIDKIKEYNRYI